MTDEFRTFEGVLVDDAGEYVSNYISENPDARVFIGSDSQVKSDYIVFATVICLYKPGTGAHIIYSKATQEDDHMESLHQRLMREVNDTMQVAFKLREQVGDRIEIEVHFDIAEDAKHKSNVAYGDAVGYAMGSDFEFKTKPAHASFAASCVADKIC
jgi:predicted RNase H-related nuclease YkuK (DUF458 family)